MVCKHLVGEGFLDKGTGRLDGELQSCALRGGDFASDVVSCKSSGCVSSSVSVVTDVGLRGVTSGMRCGDDVGGKHRVGEGDSP